MRYKYELVTFLGLIGAMLLYIHAPAIPFLGEKVIRLTDNKILLILPPSTGFAELRFREPVNVRTVVVTPVEAGQEVSHGVVGDIEGYRSIVKLIPGSFVKEDVLMAAKEVRIDLLLSKQYPYPQVTGALVDGVEVDLALFYEAYVRSDSSRLVSTREIRVEISRILRKYNAQLSNYVMSLMVAAGGLLLFFIVFRSSKTYFSSDEALVARIKALYGMGSEVTGRDIEDAKYKFGSEYAKVFRWSKLIQSLGPALGFMLTVSSLIVALYPTVYGGTDISVFFDAIQIAMVSTFIGLFLRLEAIALQVVNNSWLMRYDEALARISFGVSEEAAFDE